MLRTSRHSPCVSSARGRVSHPTQSNPTDTRKSCRPGICLLFKLVIRDALELSVGKTVASLISIYDRNSLKKKVFKTSFVFHSLCTALRSPRPGKKRLIRRHVNYSYSEEPALISLRWLIFEPMLLTQVASRAPALQKTRRFRDCVGRVSASRDYD